jgi:hypothetical protein
MTQHSSPAQTSTADREADVVAVGWGFIVWGLLYTGAVLIPTVAMRGELPPLFLWFAVAAICSGVGMVFIGIGLKKHWKYILVAAVPLCIFGLFQFPIGTAIFGWALRPLWRLRGLFYPFDRNAAKA